MNKKYDLIVAGGGFAGAAAAISAAREGLSVLLLERTNCLGGSAASSLVNPFMANHTTVDGEKKLLSQGIFLEIAERLAEMDGIDDRLCYFDEEALKIVLNRMAIESGAELLFHTWVCGSVVENGYIKSVETENRSGRQSISADYFIDATGDADLAAMSGVPYRLGRENDGLCQPMTLCFRIANADIKRFYEVRDTAQALYKEWKKQGKIKNPREDILIFDTLHDGIIHVNSTRIVKLNPTDASDFTRAEIEAREQVYELHSFLRENVAGFENSRVLSTAMQIGVRESRMIDGHHILNENELKSCKIFEDSIALGNYDIDIHNPEGSGTSHYYFPPGEFYTIPYRSLVPLKINNLLVAGRCISATHEAQASVRIMPIVCCLGQAAGVAAAIARGGKSDMIDINTDDLRKKLNQYGAAI